MDGVMVQIAVSLIFHIHILYKTDTHLTFWMKGIYPTILIVLVNFGKAHLDNEFGYNGDGLAMQRQEATSVETGLETSRISRVYDLNGMFIAQDQSRDEAEESRFQEVDISDRKDPAILV